MQLKEKIHDAIEKMPKGALALLYEQIKAMENAGNIHIEKRSGKYTLKQIHEITESSKSCWSDVINEGREERI